MATLNTFKIFIVEDDPWYGEMLKYYLTMNDEYDVTLFDNGKDCLNHLHLKPDVVSIDFNLSSFFQSFGNGSITNIFRQQ